MKLIRLLFKIPALPLAFAFWILKWIGMFFLSMSGWILRLLAGLLFLLGIVLKLFGTTEWSEILPLWGLSFAVFIVPHIATTITALFDAVSSSLIKFILS